MSFNFFYKEPEKKNIISLNDIADGKIQFVKEKISLWTRILNEIKNISKPNPFRILPLEQNVDESYLTLLAGFNDKDTTYIIKDVYIKEQKLKKNWPLTIMTIPALWVLVIKPAVLSFRYQFDLTIEDRDSKYSQKFVYFACTRKEKNDFKEFIKSNLNKPINLEFIFNTSTTKFLIDNYSAADPKEQSLPHYISEIQKLPFLKNPK